MKRCKSLGILAFRKEKNTYIKKLTMHRCTHTNIILDNKHLQFFVFSVLLNGNEMISRKINKKTTIYLKLYTINILDISIYTLTKKKYHIIMHERCKHAINHNCKFPRTISYFVRVPVLFV
ncbi:hypothetical protein C0J52_26667 [Blattella germanica]|nr:hypothetical protein C0J52_26667 [Blattella germanica]